MRSPYNNPRPILRPIARAFPHQERGSCLNCRYSKKRQGGLFCHGCYGMGQVFSPRVSSVLTGEERWALHRIAAGLTEEAS
ncbi:hypothetical protein [Leptolyngbya sp. Heron Island J]|uniref:hypothetical protein n=1 Tax=Leptolyngbya sp. Heron Island J TaxID=1385935 RepID=UPI001F2FD07B|nr:hypothetical protein [Leptolyngbya sp. Heron Island J]